MTDWLLTVASWETRFLKGLEHAIGEHQPSNVLLYFYREYADWSHSNRAKVSTLCRKKGISIQHHELSFKDYPASWGTLYKTITDLNLQDRSVTVDFTTMPRETIWTVLDLLESGGATVSYTYYEPARYNKQWLSRDPARPRFVFKLSGEPRLGLPTKLLVLTGYDVDRVRQLIRSFEPQKTFLGVQVGTQLSNQSQNVDKTRRAFGGEGNGVQLFDVDAYADDHGFRSVKEILEPHLSNSNIIMSSLGPKLSALALYELHKQYPQTSLAYAPSNEFNRRYSFGIGRGHQGNL